MNLLKQKLLTESSVVDQNTCFKLRREYLNNCLLFLQYRSIQDLKIISFAYTVKFNHYQYALFVDILCCNQCWIYRIIHCVVCDICRVFPTVFACVFIIIIPKMIIAKIYRQTIVPKSLVVQSNWLCSRKLTMVVVKVNLLVSGLQHYTGVVCIDEYNELGIIFMRFVYVRSSYEKKLGYSELNMQK